MMPAKFQSSLCLLTNTLVEVFSQCIAISTLTIIAANLVVADVITTTVVSVTLIDIYRGKIIQQLSICNIIITNAVSLIDQHVSSQTQALETADIVITILITS